MSDTKEYELLGSFADSCLRPFFIDFIEFRRTKGEKIDRTLILRIKRINDELARIEVSEITKEIAIYVMKQCSDDNGLVHHNDLSTFRNFTRYLSAFKPNTFIIPKNFWKTRRIGIRTYTFTHEEIAIIIEIIDEYCKGNHHLVAYYGEACPYPIIVRLLVGAGLRLNEVLSLKKKDLNLNDGVIVIYNGKNHVSRLVPLSSSLHDVMANYFDKSNPSDRGFGYIFPSARTGKQLYHNSVEVFFRNCFKIANLPLKNGESPVIHTFRHTFCTHSLDRMISSGIHPDAAITALSSYVGHTDLRVTYRYLHMSDSALEKFYASEAILDDLIPVAEEDENYEW